MLELSPLRKNKVNLADYNYQQDIENRILMSDFSTTDVEVLEEILYSSLKTTLKKLGRNLECTEDQLLNSLNSFSKCGLVQIEGEIIYVDKELRKYFEFQISRFDPHFKVDMEFMQGVLRKVPIHTLPTWYAIPRSSNNIFESIVEKYLFTPQLYQRYLSELNFGNPLINSIIEDLFSTPDFTISTSDIISKYNLKRKDFEEILLILEFNFVCSLCYKKEGDHWLEFIVPLHEWHEYLLFIQSTEVSPIEDESSIQQTSTSVFAFIEEMTEVLAKTKSDLTPVSDSPFVKKLILAQLAQDVDGKLHPTDIACRWMDMSLEDRALYLYRNPHNHILSMDAGDRAVREAEKSIKRVLNKGWIYFDDFLKGVMVPLSEKSVITLMHVGKQWKYSLPIYSEEEKVLIKATIFEWLYEPGMVITGTCEGKDCFAVTHFGRFYFQD